MNKFNIEENGYSKAEVNKFINDVITQTEGIVTRVKKQARQISELNSELEKYTIRKNIVNSLTKEILHGQGSGLTLNVYDLSVCILNFSI